MEKSVFIKVYINIKQLPLFRITRPPSPQCVRAISAPKPLMRQDVTSEA